MRETYSTLLQKSKNLAIDDKTSSTNGISDVQTILVDYINDTIQFLFQLIRNYKTQPLPKTFSTVADQQFYHLPSDLINVESLTIAIGDINYPLKPINSQEMWDRLNQLDITSSDIPQYYFVRQYDIGIYPTPSDAYTGTLIANYLPQRLTVLDYTDGTVAVAQNSATVTGTDTTFTSAMVGRWFCETNSSGNFVGKWYKITGFTSTTVITLETVFEETALSGSTYVIAQSPELPDEMHSYIPYMAVANYYAGFRKDPEQAQRLLNYFYTGDYFNNNRGGGVKGGILSIINRYKNLGRSNSSINYIHKSNYVNNWRDEAWATTLSPAS